MSIPLDRIVKLSVPIAWHEAVAIAQQVARTAANGGGRAIGLDNLLLTDAGAVEIAGTSRAPFTVHPALGTLGALLDRQQAPRELVTLLDRPGASPDLANELEFFLRPDAAEGLAAVAARFRAAESDAAQQAEIERLRAHSQRGRNSGEDWLDFQPEEGKKTARSRRPLHPWLVGAAAMAVAAIVGVMAALRVTADAPRETTAEASVNGVASVPAPPRSPVEQITARFDALVDKGLATLGLVPASAPAAEATLPDAAKSARRTAAPRRTPVLEPVPRIAVVMSPAPVAPAGAEPGFIVAAAEAGEGGERNGEGEDGPVAPPILRWPQLPNEPGTVPVQPGSAYLELLINEIGTVDKVRLHASDNPFHARMLVSAAKAWVFHPAQKDGRAVRYLMKVPIIID